MAKRKEIKRRRFLLEHSSAPALELSRVLNLKSFERRESEQEKAADRAGGRGEKWLTSLTEYSFWRGLQNSEMCLLFSVGKLTRNRYRSSVMLTAFDTGDGLLVGTNSPSAETDYFMCPLS